MKNTMNLLKLGIIGAAMALIPFTISAQPPGAPGGGGGSSLPAPGSGGNAPLGPNGIGWNPGPNPAAPGWGGFNNGWPSSWNWNPMPSATVNPVIVNPNQGYQKVIACGYDSQGSYKIIPMLVAYQWGGGQYNVTVLNAWNPYTLMWDKGIDMAAFNTFYNLRGVNYNFYTPLSTGTYYFNL